MYIIYDCVFRQRLETVTATVMATCTAAAEMTALIENV
jgi:hypothetical protein